MKRNGDIIFETYLASIEDTFDLKTKERRTILDDMELLIIGLKELGLSESFFIEYGKYTKQVCALYGLTTKEAILFSIFIEESDRNTICTDQLRQLCRCSKIKILSYMHEIDKLEEKKLIRRINDSIINNAYRVPEEVVEAVSKNLPYILKNRKNLTLNLFFEELNLLFEEAYSKDMHCFDLLNELEELVESNPHLDFVKKLHSYKIEEETLVIFLYYCKLLVSDDFTVSTFSEFKPFIHHRKHNEIKISLNKGTHPLFGKGLLENVVDNRLGQIDEYQLTIKSKEEFKLLPYLKMDPKNNKNLKSYKTIDERRLYYNPTEQAQIERLERLLKAKDFAKIQKRLKATHFRIGFACIFYGAPGTGKTETVYQLAKRLKRDLFIVNIADIRSKWFGESEKIIQKIFTDYNKIVSEVSVAPILVFNEADAIFSKRKTSNTGGNIEQTENTIQNIILNEMETLKGILIATTNLTQNLDSAFERRFLFKVKFEKPSLDAKISIWESMISKFIGAEKAISIPDIAKTYDFTGGQIENIARKCQIDIILNNNDLTLEKIHTFCKEETLTQEKYTRIGYKR
jgi:hypothetical protein